MSRGLTGRQSLKVKALAAVFGPSWPEAVLEWDRKVMTRAEIASAWTLCVSTVREGVTFSGQDVSDIVALARNAPKQAAGDSQLTGAAA